MVKMIQTRADPADQGSGVGHEERFPSPSLSGGCRLGKATFAGMGGKEKDAPKAVLPVNPRRPAAGMDLTVGPLSANSPPLSTQTIDR